MKYFNRLKRMKKSTKVGLATSAVYTASILAIPAFANTVEQPVEKPVLQPLDITQITTVEQADQVYNERIKAYAEDKKITKDEITDLGSILEKKNDLLYDQKKSLGKSVYQFEKPPDLTAKIREVKDALVKLGLKEDYDPGSFEKIKEDLDEKVLCYYPSLISKEKNVTYSASDAVEDKLNHVMEDLIKRADRFLKMHYQDSTLELLGEKEAYTIKDVLTFYNSIHKERPAVSFNSEEIEQKKQKLEDRLKDLTNQREHQKKSKEKQISELNQKINDVAVKIIEVKEDKDVFEKYLNAKSSINDFVEEYSDLNKYIAFSAHSVLDYANAPDGFLAHIDRSDLSDSFKSDNEAAISSLQKYFKDEGYEVEMEALKDPADTMFPWHWGWNWLFGFVFPVFRNLITASLVRRESDTFDSVEWLGEAAIFSLFLDGISPFVYPIRLFGTPFIIEPIRKWTGWRDIE